MLESKRSAGLRRYNIKALLIVGLLVIAGDAQTPAKQSSADDNSDIRPTLTQTDLGIVKRAKEILNERSVWNRDDNRECPSGAKTFSLYCALAAATIELSGEKNHRGGALQEARFVIDEVAAERGYDHRLMDYNNDPTTTFEDIQKILDITESLITLRLKGASGNRAKASVSKTSPAPKVQMTVSKTDVEIVKRTRQLLDSPGKWNRHDTGICAANGLTFSLICALAIASKELMGGTGSDDAAMAEARHLIDATAPNRAKYSSRLVDFNNDPTVTFADLQNFLRLLEEHLTERLSASVSK